MEQAGDQTLAGAGLTLEKDGRKALTRLRLLGALLGSVVSCAPVRGLAKRRVFG
jgi:hypothetical protein